MKAWNNLYFITYLIKIYSLLESPKSEASKFQSTPMQVMFHYQTVTKWEKLGYLYPSNQQFHLQEFILFLHRNIIIS